MTDDKEYVITHKGQTHRFVGVLELNSTIKEQYDKLYVEVEQLRLEVKKKDSIIETIYLDLDTLEANALKRISQLEDEIANISFEHLKVDIKAESVEDLIIQLESAALHLKQATGEAKLDTNDIWTLSRVMKIRDYT